MGDMKSIWKGSISFGLVNIPVQMYTASQTQEIKFNLLHEKDHSQIRYARICKEEDKEVPWNEIVKGYQTEQGEYIVISDKDIEKALSEKSNLIEILYFTDQDQIDPIYFEKPYILTPDKSSDKPYSLLLEVINKSKKTAIARFVMHNREHIAAIYPFEGFILLNQLRYHSELKSLEELTAPKAAKSSAKEIEIALQLVKHMEKKFDPTVFHDTYVDSIKKAIKQLQKGKKIPTPTKARAPSKKIHDIMSLLKASIAGTEKKPTRRTRAS